MSLAFFRSLGILLDSLAVLLEDEVNSVEQLLLSLADLHGVQLVFVGDHADGFHPASRLHGDTGFEFGAETPSGCLF